MVPQETKASVIWDMMMELKAKRQETNDLKEMALASVAETKVNVAVNHLEAAVHSLEEAAKRQAVAIFQEEMKRRQESI